MNQHESRKVAMQAVFAANQNRDLDAQQLETSVLRLLRLTELSAYTKTLIEGVLDHRQELEQDVGTHLKSGWKLDRINKTVLAILEVAIYEIKYSKQIDPKAAINEALNLCSEFADAKNKPFINGLLANFLK